MRDVQDNQIVDNVEAAHPALVLRLQEENALLRQSAMTFGALAERLAAALRARTPSSTDCQFSEGLVGSF
jgi:hypothetical protein